MNNKEEKLDRKRGRGRKRGIVRVGVKEGGREMHTQGNRERDTHTKEQRHTHTHTKERREKDLSTIG